MGRVCENGRIVASRYGSWELWGSVALGLRARSKAAADGRRLLRQGEGLGAGVGLASWPTESERMEKTKRQKDKKTNQHSRMENEDKTRRRVVGPISPRDRALARPARRLSAVGRTGLAVASCAVSLLPTLRSFGLCAQPRRASGATATVHAPGGSAPGAGPFGGWLACWQDCWLACWPSLWGDMRISIGLLAPGNSAPSYGAAPGQQLRDDDCDANGGQVVSRIMGKSASQGCPTPCALFGCVLADHQRVSVFFLWASARAGGQPHRPTGEQPSEDDQRPSGLLASWQATLQPSRSPPRHLLTGPASGGIAEAAGQRRLVARFRGRVYGFAHGARHICHLLAVQDFSCWLCSRPCLWDSLLPTPLSPQR